MDVSVVIPARDAEATLPRALAALAAQEGAGAFEVIVVDDGSAVPIVAPTARVLRGEGHGPAAARNLGAAAATGAVLAFTDADCEPAPGWLAAGLRACERAELVQGKVTPPPGVQPGPYDRFLSVLAEYGLYETANLFVDRGLFERLGGFESILRPRNGIELGEDAWLGWRARRGGARTAFAADALVHHAVFPRGPREYVAERARLRFFPELAARIPELRDGFFHRRWFMTRRTARFDLAAAGVVGSLLLRRRPLLALVIPYARLKPSATDLAADLVGAGALAYGSLRSRSFLL